MFKCSGNQYSKCRHYLLLASYFSVSQGCFAVTRTLGEVFVNLGNQFPDFGRLIISVAWVAGLGFGIAAVYKFKQYKDNPTQIPVGTPIALLIVSALLVFMPAIMKPAAKSLFGTTAGSGWFIGSDAVTDCLPGHDCTGN